MGIILPRIDTRPLSEGGDSLPIGAQKMNEAFEALEGAYSPYTHPSNHAPSVISQDANNRFVTDAEKATWNGKASTSVATTSAAGLMSAADKGKLDGMVLAALTIASIESY